MNLERQYDDVIECLSYYRAFQGRLARRMVRSMLRPGMFREVMLASTRQLREINYLSGRASASGRAMIERIATPEDRRSEWYEVATADYPTDALAEKLVRRFPDVSFGKLKKLHDLRKARLFQLSMKGAVGLVFATSALLLKTVPKTVIEKRLGLQQVAFEEGVFWYTLALAGYLILILLPAQWKLSRARTTHEEVGLVLDYIAAEQGEGK